METATSEQYVAAVFSKVTDFVTFL